MIGPFWTKFYFVLILGLNSGERFTGPLVLWFVCAVLVKLVCSTSQRTKSISSCLLNLVVTYLVSKRFQQSPSTYSLKVHWHHWLASVCTATCLILAPEWENQQFGFGPGLTQTKLYSYWRWLQAWNFVFRKKRYCTIQVAKTKTLISLTAKLICVIVFAYANRWFSHAGPQILEMVLSTFSAAAAY